MNKIIYNVIIFTNDLTKGNKGYITYHKVNCLNKFRKFADKEHPYWVFANVFNNSTKEKIETIKRIQS